MDCAKLSLSCASPQKQLHLGSLGKASSKSLSDVTLSKDRARAGKPRKHWLNELSCMKSLAHTGEVKGQNLYKVYGQPVWETLRRLWRVAGLSVLAAHKKKALTQQLISRLTLNNPWTSFHSQLIQSLLLYLLESNLSKKLSNPFYCLPTLQQSSEKVPIGHNLVNILLCKTHENPLTSKAVDLQMLGIYRYGCFCQGTSVLTSSDLTSIISWEWKLALVHRLPKFGSIAPTDCDHLSPLACLYLGCRGQIDASSQQSPMVMSCANCACLVSQI